MAATQPTTTDTLRLEDDVEVEAHCVACGVTIATAGCCSFACVCAARRELDDNVARLRQLQLRDGPAASRARLTERNGRLTAALMGWRQ